MLTLEKHGVKWPLDELENVPFVVLGMGKLGGREPNYHSDVDVIFLYGTNDGFEGLLPSGVSAQFFYSELAVAIMQAIGKQDTRSRLFEIDCRLRPSGKSGSLAVHVDEFAKYFATGVGQLWERQALCKARFVAGSEAFGQKVMEAVRKILHLPCPDSLKEDIWQMRLAMQRDCQPKNLKRGPGGTVDIEFAVQMLQLTHGRQHPNVLQPGTLKAIDALGCADLICQQDSDFFREQYQFLRSVESGLRLMNTTARHDLPDDAVQLERLAFLLNEPSGEALASAVRSAREQVRSKVEALFQLSLDQR